MLPTCRGGSMEARCEGTNPGWWSSRPGPARGHDRVALLGAVPDRLARGRGWIVPGRPLSTVSGRGAYAIARFVDQPEAAMADSLLAGGALWNTFVLAAKVEPLWALAQRYL